MHSEPAISKPLDLSPIVGQIVDKSNAEHMLCYGEFNWKTFRSNHKLSIESFKDSIIGGEKASPSDLVVSVDYLNTVGALRIHDVLDDLRRVTRRIGFFHVKTDYEIEDLRAVDRPHSWWIAEFMKRFELQTFQRIPYGFYVIVYAKAN